MKNFRITIGRQYGSGGKEIGRILSQKLGIPFYGKEELMKIAKDQPDYEEVRAFYEEQPVNSLLYAIAMEQGENGQERFLPEDKGTLRQPFLYTYRTVRQLHFP